MTARAGAALSHVLVRVDRIAFFGSSGAANFSTRPGQASSKAKAGIRSARMHGGMSHPQGTPDSAWPSNVRITWRNLLPANFDFAFQYYKVLYE